MSLKKVYDKQPNEFTFNDSNLKLAEKILTKYPSKNKKSAVMPLLYLAQKQNQNWIPLAAMKYIARYLSILTLTYMRSLRFTQCITFHQLENISYKCVPQVLVY